MNPTLSTEELTKNLLKLIKESNCIPLKEAVDVNCFCFFSSVKFHISDAVSHDETSIYTIALNPNYLFVYSKQENTIYLKTEFINFDLSFTEIINLGLLIKELLPLVKEVLKIEK